MRQIASSLGLHAKRQTTNRLTTPAALRTLRLRPRRAQLSTVLGCAVSEGTPDAFASASSPMVLADRLVLAAIGGDTRALESVAGAPWKVAGDPQPPSRLLRPTAAASSAEPKWTRRTIY